MTSTAPPAIKPRRWLRHILIGLTAVCILLGSAGVLYQSSASSRDRRAHPMPGRRVDVGGYKMHLDCAGQGAPAVILDSGLGDSYVSWQIVQPAIAQFTLVCSYDRAGLGYSDSSPRPRTSKVIAQELRTLLHNAAIEPPYILVGHSMGGYDVRLYASLYPHEVAGMVLVDSSHPAQQTRLPPALLDRDASWVRQQEFLAFTMPFGIPRLLGFCDHDAGVRAAECNLHSTFESVSELKSVSQSAAQAAASGALGDIPLVVLSHDPDHPEPELPEDLVKPVSDTWQQMQNELAGLSTRSTHVIAKNSGHYIQIDRPDLVTEAVRKVAGEARELRSTPESQPR